MKNTIAQALQKALEAEDIKDVSIHVTVPSDQKHGDYTSNAAMVAAKKIGKNPFEVAEGLKGTLSEMAVEGVRKIEVVKPGFLNFWLDQEFIIAQLNERGVTRSPLNVRQGETLDRRKVMVEYTDPNPFKDFHIGHLFTNIIGESLTRLFEASGDQVWRADFFGDVGMHAAKAIYGIREKLCEEGMTLEDVAKQPLQKRIEFMGKGYTLGASVYETSEEKKEQIKQINTLIFIAAQQYWQETKGIEPKVDYRQQLPEIDETFLAEIKTLWVIGRTWSLDYFETIYKRLGTTFDGYYPESLTGEWGYAFVMEGLEKGVFERSDGAIVYKGEKQGLHTRVFINKLGLPTNQ